jgi:hypothetical protein
MRLRDYSDEDLLSSMTKLTGSHRELTAEIVAHLAEIEDRRLHLLAGFSSMFEFCTKALRFSEGEAFRRILAARLSRRFPAVHSLLASGDVNLSTLELLRPWLTDENHGDLLAAVAGKGKREVQSLLAARFPQPDRPSRIWRATLEPLSEARFRIEFSASEALRKKLEQCQDLMSHANPSRDLSVVIERGVDLLLDHLQRKRLKKIGRPRQVGGDRGRTPSGVTNLHEGRSCGITNAVRREVYERDGLRCTYVAEDGRRCEGRAFLELDHAVAKALGGSSDANNLRVLCRAHNQLCAERTFGREWIEGRRHFRQQKSTAVEQGAEGTSEQHASPAAERTFGHEWIEGRRHFRQQKSTAVERRAEGASEQHPRLATRQTGATTFDKVRLALRGMGFRSAEAERTVATVIRMHDGGEPLTLEQTLREALRIATAA